MTVILYFYTFFTRLIGFCVSGIYIYSLISGWQAGFYSSVKFHFFPIIHLFSASLQISPPQNSTFKPSTTSILEGALVLLSFCCWFVFGLGFVVCGVSFLVVWLLFCSCRGDFGSSRLVVWILLWFCLFRGLVFAVCFGTCIFLLVRELINRFLVAVFLRI